MIQMAATCAAPSWLSRSVAENSVVPRSTPETKGMKPTFASVAIIISRIGVSSSVTSPRRVTFTVQKTDVSTKERTYAA